MKATGESHSRPETTVVGTKIKPPLGDAVGFVDDKTHDVELAQHPQERIRRESLGSDIQQAPSSGLHGAEHFPAMLGRQHRVQST